MVPEGVESRAMARWTEFLKRKDVTAGVKPVWRYFGTLPGVLIIFISSDFILHRFDFTRCA